MLADPITSPYLSTTEQKHRWVWLQQGSYLLDWPMPIDRQINGLSSGYNANVAFVCSSESYIQSISAIIFMG